MMGDIYRLANPVFAGFAFLGPEELDSTYILEQLEHILV